MALILIILLINGFLAYKKPILGCGLVAFCGSKEPVKAKLILTALLNESRGRHSCGVFTNNKILWGKGTDKLISDFIKKVEERFTNNVLIHMRHATVGTADNAHPFGFRRSRDGNIVINEDNKPYEIVGMHNGTIDNWQELKQQYELGAWADMDSKVILGSIFKEKNFDVLSKYVGAAALILYNTNDNKMYVYKGGTISGEPERTLFYIREEEGLYFSSEYNPLSFLSKTIYTVPNDTLLEIQDGVILNTLKVKRNRTVNLMKVIKPDNFAYADEEDDAYPLKDHVYLWKGRYYLNGLRVDGGHSIKNGRLETYGTEKHYFVDGILVKGYTEFYDAGKLLEEAFKKGTKIDFVEFSKKFNSPSCVTKDKTTSKFFTNYEPDVFYINGEPVEGSVVFPIVDQVYSFTDGLIEGVDDEVEEFKFELYTWMDEFYEIISAYSHLEDHLDDDTRRIMSAIDAILVKLKANGIPINSIW